MKLKGLYYGWFIVLGCFLVQALNSAAEFAPGVFLKPLVSYFECGRGDISGTFSLYILIIGSGSILSGKLSDKYGPRIVVTFNALLVGLGYILLSQVNSLWQMYLVWVVIGIGGSGCWAPTVSTVARWFTKRRGMAMGIVVAGFAVGGMIIPPFAQWLISSYSWQEAYLALGVITLIILLPSAQFIKRSPQQIGPKPLGELEKAPQSMGNLSFIQLIKNRQFWPLASTFLFFQFCCLLGYNHTVAYAIDTGMPEMVAATLMTIVASASLAGRLMIGFISDVFGSRLTLVYTLILFVTGFILLMFTQQQWAFYPFAVVFGLTSGGVIALQGIMVADLFSSASLGMGIGSVMAVGLTGAILGPIFGGYTFDVTGSYQLAWGGCVILGIVSILLSLKLSRSKGAKSEKGA
jgi:MFS family permease